MSDRAVPGAALVAVVILIGTVAGGLVAASLDDDDGRSLPRDADVLAALATRGLDDEQARCALPVFADPTLRARVVDATDSLDDVAAVEACRQAARVTTTTATTLVAGSLTACTGAAAGDPAAVEVCAVDALVGLLRAGTELDEVTASCAADAVVDELGVDAVVTALETGVLPDDLRRRLQEAFAACR